MNTKTDLGKQFKMQRQTKGTFSFPDQDQNTQALDSGTFDSHGTKRPSDSTKNNFEEHFVSNKNKNLTSQRSKGVDVKSESQKRDKYHKMKQPFHHPTCMLLESQCVYDYPRTPPVSTDVSIPNQINDLPEDVRMEFNNRSKSKQMLNPSISNVRNAIEKSLTERDTNIDKCCSHHDKDIAELKKLKEMLNPSVSNVRNAIEKSLTERDKNIGKCCSHRDKDIAELKKLKEINVLPEEVRMEFNNRSKSKQGREVTRLRPEQTLSPLLNNWLKNAAADKRSTFESTLSRLYRNVIRNETSRMISSIDMVGFEAEHLFGLERSQIFFNLLDEELCQFGSAGAISDFVPNMAESTVRQHVVSFFEHAYDMMSRLMTLLSSCPDSRRLQQMPEQNFISLIKSVIKSSLKAQTKGREKLSLEGNIYTMVDQKDFERAQGEISEDVLNRLKNEDEIDTRLDLMHQPSDRKEDRPIHCIYFPSDCRLFIYIPPANGSYWHQLDMQRAYRIRRHHI